MRRPFIMPSLFAVSLLFTLTAIGADAPDKDKSPEFIIGEMRVTTIKGCTYLYTSSETTLADITKAIVSSHELLLKAAATANVHFIGPAINVYHGLKPESKFTMDVGFPVGPDTTPPGDLKVRHLEDFRCATLLYTGSVAHITEAYTKLYEQLIAAGYTPTEESREMMLYWEGPDSQNNVFQLMVGVE